MLNHNVLGTRRMLLKSAGVLARNAFAGGGSSQSTMQTWLALQEWKERAGPILSLGKPGDFATLTSSPRW